MTKVTFGLLVSSSMQLVILQSIIKNLAMIFKCGGEQGSNCSINLLQPNFQTSHVSTKAQSFVNLLAQPSHHYKNKIAKKQMKMAHFSEANWPKLKCYISTLAGNSKWNEKWKLQSIIPFAHFATNNASLSANATTCCKNSLCLTCASIKIDDAQPQTICKRQSQSALNAFTIDALTIQKTLT